MNNRLFPKPLLALAVMGLAPIISAGPVQAQENAVSPAQTVTFTVDQAPIQSVLRTLFAGRSYSVDPSVQGTVSVNLQNVSFDVALRSVLRASNPPLTMDMLGGAYAIKVKPADTPALPAPATRTASVPDAVRLYRVPVDSYDAYYLATLMQQSRGLQIVQPNYVNPGAAAGGTGSNNRRGNNGGGRRGNRNFGG